MRRRAIGEMNTTGLHRNIYKFYVHKALRWMLPIMPVLIPFFWENGLDLQDILILQAAFLVAGALSLVRLHRNAAL